MNLVIRFAVRLSLSLTLTSLASARDAAGPASEDKLKLRICLYDYAQLSEAMIGWARNQASDLLSKAEIQIEWVDCSMSLSADKIDPSCRVSSPTALVLKLLPHEMAARFGLPPESFGFSNLPSKKGGFGTHASIFVHRIEDLAADREPYRALLLGYLMAHEIAHLLLGSGSHSERGIMQAIWRNKDVEDAIRGKLRFNPHQNREMRALLVQRMGYSQRPQEVRSEPSWPLSAFERPLRRPLYRSQ